MQGEFTVDQPLYDAIFAGMAKAWPQYEEQLEICTPCRATSVCQPL
jgi:hypothetical protein